VDIRDPGVAGVGAHSVSRHGAAVIVRVVLAALSFLIYVAAVLSLHQERTVPLLVEQDGPIPVVISHWLCRAPFGLTDSGLKDLSAIPPVLLALTWLLITFISGPPRLAYAQEPIGGIRYYAVIGILPALHWCFEPLCHVPFSSDVVS
jgi:hypothetical protein